MYKRIDFTKLEGYGLTQDDLDFMQVSYRDAISSLASILGDYVIISGVNTSGSNYTDGWVAINGEILPFVGGLIATNVIIEETSADNLFEDGTTKTVYFTRIAKPASSGGTAFSGFVRLDSLKTLKANLATAQTTATNANTNANGRVSKTGDTMTGALVVPGVNTDNAIIKTKIINIGVWNMDANGSTSVPHGLPDHTKIRSVEATIIVDGGTAYYDLKSTFIGGGGPGMIKHGGGIVFTAGGNITLHRVIDTDGGLFDNSGFSGSGNRGYIVIQYIA
jgi:hypothetical protein